MDVHRQRNQPLPADLQAKVDAEPILVSGEDFFYEAFVRLTTERNGQGPIPVSKIVEHGVRFGLDFENQELLVRLIRKLDSTYLGWIEEDLKRKRESAKRSK